MTEVLKTPHEYAVEGVLSTTITEPAFASYVVMAGMARNEGSKVAPKYAWNPQALEALSTEGLIDLRQRALHDQ